MLHMNSSGYRYACGDRQLVSRSHQIGEVVEVDEVDASSAGKPDDCTVDRPFPSNFYSEGSVAALVLVVVQFSLNGLLMGHVRPFQFKDGLLARVPSDRVNIGRNGHAGWLNGQQLGIGF